MSPDHPPLGNQHRADRVAGRHRPADHLRPFRDAQPLRGLQAGTQLPYPPAGRSLPAGDPRHIDYQFPYPPSLASPDPPQTAVPAPSACGPVVCRTGANVALASSLWATVGEAGGMPDCGRAVKRDLRRGSRLLSIQQ